MADAGVDRRASRSIHSLRIAFGAVAARPRMDRFASGLLDGHLRGLMGHDELGKIEPMLWPLKPSGLFQPIV